MSTDEDPTCVACGHESSDHLDGGACRFSGCICGGFDDGRELPAPTATAQTPGTEQIVSDAQLAEWLAAMESDKDHNYGEEFLSVCLDLRACRAEINRLRETIIPWLVAEIRAKSTAARASITLAEENERLRKALEWYACDRNWQNPPAMNIGGWRPVERDKGAIASAALAARSTEMERAE